MGTRYTTPEYTCEKCGEKIIGDMPIISHAILGCKPKEKVNTAKK